MNLAGVFSPIPTPFDDRDRVDTVRLKAALAKWAAKPLAGFVVLGSNGEAALMDDFECDQTIVAAREAVPHDKLFIVGTGRESTQGAVKAARRAAEHGADAVLVRTPGFFKSQMTNDVFVRHYTAVADASPVPVLLYNFTAVTGVNLLPAAVARLATHPNIIGMKESGGDVAQVADLVSLTPDGFQVLAGAAATLYPMMCVGAIGGILALANALPEPCVRLFELARDGKHDEALSLQRDLVPIARLLGATHGVPGLKAALNLLGYDVGAPRPPLLPLPDANIQALRDALARFEEIARMSLLPDTERILLGPGPSLTAPRVMRAMAAPTLSHLDPQMMALLDDVRARLGRVFRAEHGSLAFAVSGTGTSGMETTVANLVQDGTRVTVVVGGYFGDRLAQMCTRYGAVVTRLDVEWGRACDPEALRQQLKATPADVVCLVQAETSTGVLHPVGELAAIAREQGALTIVDAVTSLGGIPLEVGAWGIDAAYSCTQKCLGGPSGLAPVVFGPRALARRVKCRSFYFDLSLLEDYWLRRKYHHTMSSSLVYALYESLAIIEEEGLAARWARHERNHRALLDALAGIGLSVLPREGERLWTLNAVRVPDGIDEAAVRAYLLEIFNIEIGAGLGPLAGKIWRVGLMGASSSPRLIVLLTGALERALARQRQRV